MSRVDHIYRSILLTKFFTKGWGKPENLRRIFAFRRILSNRETCRHLVRNDHPITITKEINNADHVLLEAEFQSPFVEHLPGLLPPESEKAYFQMIAPKTWKTPLRPTCLHLAGTGDHGYWRRRVLMARPLLEEDGIASIMLENPFYGLRKPKEQLRSSLRNVSDLFVMGGCLVLESLAIFHWCERMGFGPLGITGISMGGHMASLAATSWHKPLPLIPCLSWSTASGVFTQMASAAATNWHKPLAAVPILSWTTASGCFTQGVLSGAINWEMLKNQYFSDQVFRDVLFNMIHSPEGHFRLYHEVGQHFARVFPQSLAHIELLQEELKGDITTANKCKQEDERGKVYNKSIDITNPKSVEKCTKQVLEVETELENNSSKEILKQTKNHIGNYALNANFSLSKLNVLQGFGMTKSKISKNTTSAGNKSSSKGNIILDYKSAKSQVFRSQQQEQNYKRHSQFTPVGIRPSNAKDMKPVSFEPYVEVKDPLTWEAVQFMRGIMDECTHLGNFSVPVDPSLIIIVAAKNDAYMPRDGIIPLNEIWPGAELRTLETGHITAYLFNQQVFREAIRDAFQRVTHKYYNEKLEACEGGD
ncbi:protein ABHD18 isoform X2 [Oratosquilla oratoria]|uniref:protein ABHD18 isoform X2 n=1 Tax=Oratosquilla oratoria TaxID=337810 RepID=UPI003F75DF8F